MMANCSVNHSRRDLLEAFKFLDWSDLVAITTVSKWWKTTAECDELWQQFLLFADRHAVTMREEVKEQMLQPHFLAKMCMNEVVIADLDIQTDTRIPFQSPFQHSEFPSWVSLPSGILYCGGLRGGITLSIVTLIAIPSGSIQPLPTMLHSRAGGGVAYAGGKVFVFGGVKISSPGEMQHLLQCESFDLRRKAWTAVGEMTAPAQPFLPSRYKSCIYLTHAQGIDEFHILSHSFRLVLPLPCINDFSVTISFPRYMIILCESKGWKIDRESWTVIEERSVQMRNWYSPGGAVICGNEAYFAEGADTLWKVDGDLRLSKVEMTESGKLKVCKNC